MEAVLRPPTHTATEVVCGGSVQFHIVEQKNSRLYANISVLHNKELLDCCASLYLLQAQKSCSLFLQQTSQYLVSTPCLMLFASSVC
jgi:hypothetical protein